jgi:hypothetical protein
MERIFDKKLAECQRKAGCEICVDSIMRLIGYGDCCAGDPKYNKEGKCENCTPDPAAINPGSVLFW